MTGLDVLLGFLLMILHASIASLIAAQSIILAEWSVYVTTPFVWSSARTSPFELGRFEDSSDP